MVQGRNFPCGEYVVCEVEEGQAAHPPHVIPLSKMRFGEEEMMRLTSLKVEGFRSLASIQMPLRDYTILIGRNNSGKSSVLLSIKLLFEGTSRDLRESLFFFQVGRQVDQFTIEATLEGVSEYLPLCHERHSGKIKSCIFEDKLRIRRVATRSPLKLGKLELWQPSTGDFGLPTGIDSALKQFLPEIVFIEAFKKPTDEAQAKSSATLGKILKQIVQPISAKLESEVQGVFRQVARKFNVIEEEGGLIDERPEEIKRIESRIRQHIQSVFDEADVRLRFHTPRIDDLIGASSIELKDRGPWTSPDGKGQGFQRTLYLALLRALADELREDTTQNIHRPFLLLFEEPEIFLHPALQREMGAVLESISHSNQAIIATHSPFLVTSRQVQNVLILRQMPVEIDAGTIVYATHCFKPDDTILPSSDDKQLASLLRFSNSAEFLFADCVLVVEGPSDRALLKASWEMLRKSLRQSSQLPLALSIVEAGSKSVVHVWLKYLGEGMGFLSRGLVDLDFLWNGAGQCLGSDSDLSQFTERFWDLAKQRNLLKNGSNHRIKDGKKQEAFRLILENEDLKQKAGILRRRLRDEFGIWVLGEGEIEHYFGLSRRKKGLYAAVSQQIRNEDMEVPSEIKEVLKWIVTSFSKHTELPQRTSDTASRGASGGGFEAK